jgi:hypothetical protein
MTQVKSDRRELMTLVAGGALAAGFLAVSSGSAEAYQGNMERALASLQDAFDSLRHASSNKGGHREKAMHMIESAMQQVQAGIDFANQHGGGGAD